MKIHNPKSTKVNVSRYIIKPQAQNDDFAQEIVYGLTRKNKFIPSKYLYDKRGSELFDRICELPEYYPTKKELEILSSFKDEFSSYLDGSYAVVELGSGSAIKTKHLFEVLSGQKTIPYYPIDISDVITESSARLQDEFSNLHITGIIDQYEGGLEHIKEIDGKKIVVFFGSSVGNFDQKEAIEFLRMVYDSLNDGDLFLLGVDLIKDVDVLETAYNDSAGITAEFNLNLLRRINNELGGDFVLKNFEHLAFYNPQEKRIEMHLRSKKDQLVSIADVDLLLNLKKDETIRTEYSHKYSIPQIKQMADDVGFVTKKIWTDSQNYFALALLAKVGGKK